MASNSAGSGENSNSTTSSSGWYPQVVQPKRNQFEGKLEEQNLMSLSSYNTSSSNDHRFCRLCLSKEQQLKPLFPPNGSPDGTLIRKIFSCLTIALSFEEDYDTFVCRVCVQEVAKFFVYKEQCLANDAILRGRVKPAKVNFFNDVQGIQAPNDDVDDDEQDFEPIDSDEFDIPDEGDYNQPADNSANVYETPSVPLESGLALEPWKLKPLPKQRARRENVQDYYYGGYRYTCATSRANGKVHWRCMYKSKLKCRAAILVSPNGTISCGSHRHNHRPDKKPLSNHADGTIIDVHTGQKVTYKLIKSNRSPTHQTQMICNGYKYRYARSTQKQTTYWRCMKHNGKENCKAILSFRTDFSACSSNGHSHNHPAQYDMNKPLPSILDDEPPLYPEQPPISNGIVRIPDVGKSMKNGKKMKNAALFHKRMVHNGYEFGFPRIDRQYSRWACFKKSLFNCPANLVTNSAGRVIKESDWAHNHGPNDDYTKETVIEGYMTDAKTSEQVYYKLIPGKRGQRFVLYKGYRYSSDRFMSDGRMAWKCTKCRVFIVIEGRFSSFEDRGGEHEHPILEEDDEQLDMGSCLQGLSGLEGDQGLEENSQDDIGVEEEMEFGVKNEVDDDDENEEEDMEEDQDAFASDEEQLIIP